ncbi:MAG: MBL fold metallo-hydrolase [Polyangiaceae bacterium]
MSTTHSLLALATATLLAAASQGCAVSSHPRAPNAAGVPSRTRDVVSALATPGPLEVETVTSAAWAVPREGLLNLEHPKAKAAGLTKGDEAIEVYFHVVRHPRKGVWLVDTGFEKALRDDPSASAMGWLVRSQIGLEKMRFTSPLGQYLEEKNVHLAGVFLTHAHLDHVGGMRDVPNDVPVYTGPGELSERSFTNLFVQGSTDRAFEGKKAVGELRMTADPDGAFDGVVDVFGDRSFFALYVPGHSSGSTAYLARTTKGPVLLVGDACHTRFGWENGVEPGEFSSDRAKSAESLARLEKFARAHPEIEVRLGHQALVAKDTNVAGAPRQVNGR